MPVSLHEIICRQGNNEIDYYHTHRCSSCCQYTAIPGQVEFIKHYRATHVKKNHLPDFQSSSKLIWAQFS